MVRDCYIFLDDVGYHRYKIEYRHRIRANFPMIRELKEIVEKMKKEDLAVFSRFLHKRLAHSNVFEVFFKLGIEGWRVKYILTTEQSCSMGLNADIKGAWDIA